MALPVPASARVGHHVPSAGSCAPCPARAPLHLRDRGEQIGHHDRAPLALCDRTRMVRGCGDAESRSRPAHHGDHRSRVTAGEAPSARYAPHRFDRSGHRRRQILGAEHVRPCAGGAHRRPSPIGNRACGSHGGGVRRAHRPESRRSPCGMDRRFVGSRQGQAHAGHIRCLCPLRPMGRAARGRVARQERHRSGPSDRDRPRRGRRLWQRPRVRGAALRRRRGPRRLVAADIGAPSRLRADGDRCVRHRRRVRPLGVRRRACGRPPRREPVRRAIGDGGQARDLGDPGRRCGQGAVRLCGCQRHVGHVRRGP